MAQQGEQAEPRLAAPAELVAILGFSRLSAAAYAVIARVIDNDGMFRARVAEAAQEDVVGRASWLWLHRPVGWQDDLGPAEPVARPDDKAGATRLRKVAATADASRRRMAEQVAQLRRTEAQACHERDQLQKEVAVLRVERNAAMRRSKEVEAQLATARRDLKVARQATTDAEVELARLRGEHRRADASPAIPGRAKRKANHRAHPVLPAGVFNATAEAHRALLADGANLLVVDGYNVARSAWSGLAPQEERHRVIALLDDVQARSGATVVVVFDGDDSVIAPKASKNVAVRFSATGQTADDAIAQLVGATPVATPVVVVSSDRAVAADARRQGAVSMDSQAFLAAAGR